MKWSSDLGQFLRFVSHDHCLPCAGCLVLVGAVRADVVVVLIHVSQDIREGLSRGAVTLRGNPLGFQAPEEPLHGRVIPAVAASAHALLHPITPQLSLEGDTGVLAALIGVEHDPFGTTSCFVGHR